MRDVTRFSDSERERLRAAVVAADCAALRVPGAVTTVMFTASETVGGRTVVGTVTAVTRLDVTAVKRGPGDWRLQVRPHGRAELLEEVPL